MRRDIPDAARRRLLGGALALGGAVAMSPLARLLAAAGKPEAMVGGYGQLRPVKDLTTGLPLLLLPPGFSYRTFGWADDPLADGTPTPAAHDGMGVVAHSGDKLVLVRNHELVTDGGAFGGEAIRYDAAAGGGTVTLEIDARDAKLLRAFPSLSGTLQNCSGGTTPWGTWLSCEEYVHEGAPTDAVGIDSAARFLPRLEKEHGFVFEVDPSGKRAPQLLEGLGQFRHEAAVVDPRSGIVYLTEDREPHSGFYRFVPRERGKLAGGGKLQMLKAKSYAEMIRGLRKDQASDVEWVDIDDPGRGHSVGRQDGSGVLEQGIARGASVFSRLEGCFAGDDAIWFVSTNGGDASSGQVFVYRPREEKIALHFESTGVDSVSYPDNLCPSPRGGMLLCEDGSRLGQLIWGLSGSGELFPFARNNAQIANGPHGITGDFRASEWAGTCFSPDGRWLFANVYAPGFSVAITGPWRRGLI